MLHKLNWFDLTLEELSRLADIVPGETIEDCSRKTVDWAGTLLSQVSLLAGLVGIRLPQPYVMDGVWLVWELEKAHIRAKLWRDPFYDGQITEDASPRPHRPSNFTMIGEIVSPELAPNEEKTLYAACEIYGTFTPDFFFSTLLDWFTTPHLHNGTQATSVDLESGEQWERHPESEQKSGISIPRGETRDIHEVVSEAFAGFAREGRQMKFVEMTLEQMGRLRSDWDGRGSPPPSPETVEWATIVFKNLDKAADSIGTGFSKPFTLLRSIETALVGPAEVSIAIGCDLGTNLVDIDVSAGLHEYVTSVAVDFNPGLEEESGKQWLVAEFTVPREDGKWPADTLRELLW